MREGDDAGDSMLLQAVRVEEQLANNSFFIDDKGELVFGVDAFMFSERIHSIPDQVDDIRGGSVIASEFHLRLRKRDGDNGEAFLCPFEQRLRVERLFCVGAEWRDGAGAREDEDDPWAGAAAGERRLEDGRGAEDGGRSGGERRGGFGGGGGIVDGWGRRGGHFVCVI